ncbi:hypothetical protein G0Q06_06410 [Puniceicoccales bacterium CK1056]|uniref:EF-hand domain-containing protein n=1 Tax=Oceanipulchritudo coccoides TaxID=2706888 RepID=A0A6B2M043_9BACT|nr:hypothetical protein [Oceanipulchritudo coccoides]NDV62073.1 hypothetical protein [Oceanipulchritudo coccoides]
MLIWQNNPESDISPNQFLKMISLPTVIRLAVTLLLLPATGAVGATNSFTNSGGDGLWSTAVNWSLGRLPNTGDDVFVNSGLTVTLKGNSTFYQAGSLTLQSNAHLVIDYGRSGIGSLLVVTGFTFEQDSGIIVDGTSYEALQGYLPLVKTIFPLDVFPEQKVTFTGFEQRSPAIVVEDKGVGLRLAAPPAFSTYLGTLVPSSRVAPDYAGTEFSATRELQPTVSAWTPTYSEAYVMDAELSGEFPDGGMGENILSWDMRIGRGGHMYSLRTPALGETVPPSYRSEPNDSPWNDEVWQGVAVATSLNDPDADPPSKYFIHHSGVYMRDPILTEPFYSPQVAAHLDSETRSYTTINWAQHPHLEVFQDGTTANDWRSDLLVFTRYRDLGKGVIEVTMGFYNYGEDILNRHNLPWGGVRRTSAEYGFISNPDGTSWGDPVTELWGDGLTESFAETGGWAAFSDSPTGNSPVLGLVYGPESAPLIPNQTRNSLLRVGYAGGEDNGTEDGWRNYMVITAVRNYVLTRGTGVWARFYFAFGSSMADLSERIQARGLTAEPELQAMEYSETDSPLIGYGYSGSGSEFRVFRKRDDAAFHLYAHPVNGSLPLYEIIEADGSRYLTWDPYASGVIKTYDGTIAGIRLLGFALRNGDTNRNNTDFAYERLSVLLAGVPQNYLPSGEDLVARLNSPLERWRLEHFGEKENAGNSADTFDFDGDGVVNLLEYALGGQPALGDSADILPVTSLGYKDGSPQLEYTFRRRVDAAARSILYAVEQSANLYPESWTLVGLAGSTITTIDQGIEDVLTSFTGQDPLFVRLTVQVSEE